MHPTELLIFGKPSCSPRYQWYQLLLAGDEGWANILWEVANDQIRKILDLTLFTNDIFYCSLASIHQFGGCPSVASEYDFSFLCNLASILYYGRLHVTYIYIVLQALSMVIIKSASTGTVDGMASGYRVLCSFQVVRVEFCRISF